MKTIKHIILGLTASLSLVSCGDFGDVNVDPNRSTELNTQFLLLRAEMGTSYFRLNSTYNPWTQLMPGYYSETSNVQHTILTIKSAATSELYRVNIANLEHIIDMAKRQDSGAGALGSYNNQIAVAETLRAYYYMHMTDVLGKIPYSEALKGREGNFTPKYDTQEEIYTDLDKRLTEAYNLFDTSSRLNATYDIAYKGDINKWKKLNASLRMMMAIKLSDVAPAIGKARFAAAFAHGGIDVNAANFSRPYLSEDANANPMYSNYIIDGRKDFAASHFVIDNLLALNDPRVATIASLANNSNKYIGFTFGGTKETILAENKEGRSYLHPSLYAQNATAEIITATHIKLIEAEAALRGWISANAETLYKDAITLAWDNHGLSTSFALPNELDATQKSALTPNLDVTAYLAQPQVALTGDTKAKIEKIALQRWLNNFNRDGVEGWSDWRRLGIPREIKPGPVSDLTRMPSRRMYDSDDYNTNLANHNAAVKDQPDDLYTRVWWDVKDND